jgi:drug/metabolite transporter (DMT)-like permease
MTPRDERLGLLFAALCAMSGAFVPALAKLTTGRATPLFVAAASNLFAGLGAALVLGMRRELGLLWRRRLGPRLLLIGALGTAAAHLLFYAGASRTSAIDTTLCLQIEPAYSLLLSWLVLGHRPTRRRVLATLVLLGGIALAVGASGFETSAGVWLLLATPLCWQVSHLVVLRGLVGVPPIVLTSARYLYGGVLLIGAWLATAGVASAPPAAALLRLAPLLALQGCVLGYAGTLLWYQAIRRLDLTRATAIVVPGIPLLAFGASFALLGEVATARQWLGLLLTAMGVLAFVTAPHAIGARERVVLEM